MKHGSGDQGKALARQVRFILSPYAAFAASLKTVFDMDTQLAEEATTLMESYSVK
jgi:hypothetical protein